MNNYVMPVAVFEALIQIQGNIYQNPKGVEIDFVDFISARINLWAKGPTSFDLYLEMPADQFMKELKITSWDDVDAIDEAQLWEQYERDNGYVWANMEYLGDGDLCFRIMNNKTVIIAERFQYHDEVAELLTDVESVRNYVRDHIKELYIAAENME